MTIDCMGWQCHYCGNASKDDKYCYKYETEIKWKDGEQNE